MTHPKAMLLAFVGFMLWTLVDTAVKLTGQAALSPFLIMLLLSGSAAAGIAGVAALRGNLGVLRSGCWREQALICGFSVINSYSSVVALKHLPLTIFYITLFTAPLVIAVLSVILKHEKPSWVKAACLIAGFVGVLIVLLPQLGDDSGAWIGYVAVACKVAAFAGTTVVIRTIAHKVTPESMVFFVSLSIALCSSAVLLVQTAPVALPDEKYVGILIVAGLLNLVATLLYNKALRHTASSNVAQVQYTQIILGALIGYLIWHEIPTGNLVAGSIIIIAAGLIVAAQARGTTEQKRQ